MLHFLFKKAKCVSLLIISLCFQTALFGDVTIGLERIFKEPYSTELKGKKIALITNQSAINHNKEEAFDLFVNNQAEFNYQLVSAFAPEHGLEGKQHAAEHVENSKKKQIPIYSLHGATRRPTEAMLQNVDLIIYDIQTVGARCYTYETTLCYVMEEAAKRRIPVMVLDRPNPRGGVAIEGTDLDEKYRCFFSYNNVPFCHGMTIGELSRYLNEDQKIHCDLKVVPMKGWERHMTYEMTNLPWVAPSPNIPDSETTLVYPATIFLGETLEIVSIDLRGAKPFKRIGAPWIEGYELANILNQRNLPGVIFIPETFTPSWGKYELEKCQGVFIKVTSPEHFQPLLTQYAIFEELMKNYPDQFEKELEVAMKKGRRKTCNYITGNENLMQFIESKKSFLDEMKFLEEHYIKDFLNKRQKYLIY